MEQKDTIPELNDELDLNNKMNDEFIKKRGDLFLGVVISLTTGYLMLCLFQDPYSYKIIKDIILLDRLLSFIILLAPFFVAVYLTARLIDLIFQNMKSSK